MTCAQSTHSLVHLPEHEAALLVYYLTTESATLNDAQGSRASLCCGICPPPGQPSLQRLRAFIMQASWIQWGGCSPYRCLSRMRQPTVKLGWEIYIKVL